MARRSKFGAVPTVVNDIRFHSKREAFRYMELRRMDERGFISDLRLQVPYLLEINGVKICKYIADFEYIENGGKITEDCKGYRTDVYKLKKKLMLAIHKIDIRET